MRKAHSLSPWVLRSSRPVKPGGLPLAPLRGAAAPRLYRKNVWSREDLSESRPRHVGPLAPRTGGSLSRRAAATLSLWCIMATCGGAGRVEALRGAPERAETPQPPGEDKHGGRGRVLRRTSPVRATIIKRSEQSRRDEISLHERRTLNTAVFEQDLTAFVEALEAPTNGTPEPAPKREAARARRELARLVAEADVLADNLEALRRALAAGDRSGDPQCGGSGGRSGGARGGIETVRRRLASKQEEVQARAHADGGARTRRPRAVRAGARRNRLPPALR